MKSPLSSASLLSEALFAMVKSATSVSSWSTLFAKPLTILLSQCLVIEGDDKCGANCGFAGLATFMMLTEVVGMGGILSRCGVDVMALTGVCALWLMAGEAGEFGGWLCEDVTSADRVDIEAKSKWHSTHLTCCKSLVVLELVMFMSLESCPVMYIDTFSALPCTCTFFVEIYAVNVASVSGDLPIRCFPGIRVHPGGANSSFFQMIVSITNLFAAKYYFNKYSEEKS